MSALVQFILLLVFLHVRVLIPSQLAEDFKKAALY